MTKKSTFRCGVCNANHYFDSKIGQMHQKGMNAGVTSKFKVINGKRWMYTRTENSPEEALAVAESIRKEGALATVEGKNVYAKRKVPE